MPEFEMPGREQDRERERDDRAMAELSDRVKELSERLDAKHSENIERLTRMESNTTHLVNYVETLHKTLFGNGQRGVISAMESRLTDIEKWVWRAIGAGFVLLNAGMLAMQYFKKP